MEAEKVEYVEAEIIESKPLPLIMHWGEVALVGAGFVMGYLIGKSKKTVRRKVGSRQKAVSKRRIRK